jgi:hypothetical protein
MNAARRLTVASLCALAGVLALWSASASAAAPEAPGPVVVESVKASEATFQGVLNPGKEGAAGTYELGTYEFLYRKSSVTCEGGGRAPESPGISLGGGKEGVSQGVTGLEAGSEYTVCLLARNGVKGETTVGPAVHFSTAIPVEAPEGVAATGVTATTATLHGVLNPHSKRESEPGSWEFRYRQSATECEGEGEEATPSTVAGGHEGEAVQTTVTGLSPGATYTFCLRASNNAGEEALGAPQTFAAAAAPPTVEEESVLNVASSSATFTAQIDPNGEETTYRFEYGTSAAYGSSVPVPDGLVGSGSTPLTVSAHPQDLLPGTEYHYRVVALVASRGEAIPGADGTFVTQPAGGEFALPDGRQWEMVSPPDKRGAGFFTPYEQEGAAIQAAEDGGAFTYDADAPLEVNPAGSRSVEPTQVISERLAPGDWETRDIVTPHTEGASVFRVGHNLEYELFSSDLSLAVLEPAGNTPLPPLPPGSEKTIYLRTASGEYIPLVSKANVPPGTKFGGTTGEEGESEIKFEGASPDLSHIVIGSGVALTATPGAGAGLYEWAGGHLEPASVLPNDEFTNVGYGGLGQAQAGVGIDVRHAVSNDGSRLVFEVKVGALCQLYLRDMRREETVLVAEGVAGAEPTYETANSEDSRVFFTDEGDLDVFEVTSGKDEPLAGKVTALTVNGGLQGVIGASEDGSYVYFADNDILYMEHYDEAAKAWAPPTFVAAQTASQNWGRGEDNLERMTSRVSPNGRYLAFMSQGSPTGYDNLDANSGVPDAEVFLYDASAGPTGRVVCASCDPTGARPVGVLTSGGTTPTFDTPRAWENSWLAADIPGWTPKELGHALYQPRFLSNSGRLFFNSFDALVPAAVNGQEDVYEFEPAGVGSCQASDYGQSSSVVFSEREDGCVGLISGGTSPQESGFLDASETGGDVFFLTTTRLSPQDYDTSYDVYDAHECTAASPCAPPPPLAPPPCTTGDACKPGPTPQPAIFGAPSSETFSGAGNVAPATSEPAVTPRSSGQPQRLAKALKACRKKPKRRRAGCESRARRRYGGKSAARVGKGLSARAGGAGSKGAGR